jgi:Flp pilus assembly protein TadD
MGTARMNQQRTEEALKLFEQAYAADRSLAVARMNYGIGLMAAQRPSDALPVLLEATRLLPRDPRPWYNLGLAYRLSQQTEMAVDAFKQAAQADPGDADSQYFIGATLSELSRFPDAINAFSRALELNPFHASAEFGVARAYQLSGDDKNAASHLARFQKITQDHLGSPFGTGYSQQGKYSVAEEVRASKPPAPLIPVKFSSVAEDAGLRFAHSPGPSGAQTLPEFLGSGACFFDFDGDGQDDLFLVNGKGGTSSLFRNTGGKFVDVTKDSGAALSGPGLGCTAGDYDNDGLVDLAVGFPGRIVLLRNKGDGKFEDVTLAAGIRISGVPMGIAFIDFDHDGDVDLYVTQFADFPWRPGDALNFPLNGRSGSNMLWRNNGNGTFTDVTRNTGLAGTAPSIAALATDANNDRAVDIALTSWSSAPAIATNPREGAFKIGQPWTAFPSATTVGVAAVDFNRDGWMDLAFTHSGAPGISLWRNVDGKTFQQVPLPDLHWTRAWGIAAIDYDNDGWIDIAAVGEMDSKGELRLLRNKGDGTFEDVSAVVGLASIQLKDPRTLVAADYDGDGDTDLLITQNNGPALLLRNDGGNKNNWIGVRLKGLNDNKSGIGTKVEVFTGESWQKWEVPSATGYLGQSSLALIAGLGQIGEVDFIRFLWPTGVPQDEEKPAIRQNHVFQELDRRGSSCPILFAWNGTSFEFITDTLGAGVVGHWEDPRHRNISDPTEYVKVEGRQLQPRDGKLSLRLLEPMEELVYLDQARLLAIDHPDDLSVFPNEVFAGKPPFPEFKVIASRGARPLTGAWDGQGRDVLPELTQRDRHYVASFGSLPFAGFADFHSLELDLGGEAGRGPLRLVMYGYVDYFSANSMYAAYQAGVTPILPYVEVQDAAGNWKRAIDSIGFPAGLARPMVADLTGRLPAGARRIRLSTNLKLYWDQILIDRTPTGQPVQIAEIPLSAAKLSFHGYPQPIEGNPRSDLTYQYDHVSISGPYVPHAGAYTRFGDVLSLLRTADDEFAIFGSGEQVELEFDASKLPSVKPGWARDYFFYADGFDKDMDFYEANSATVEPLPFHTRTPYPYAPEPGYSQTSSHLRYQLEFNSRQKSGVKSGSYRFEYRGSGGKQ